MTTPTLEQAMRMAIETIEKYTWFVGQFGTRCQSCRRQKGEKHDAACSIEVTLEQLRTALAAQPVSEPVTLAMQFHEVYERLAPSFGYETRTETRQFNPDSANGRLMIAVCTELLAIQPAKPPEINCMSKWPFPTEATRAAQPVSEPTCRNDGRCQYAIDHGAEGMGHCPQGKCCMPPWASSPENPANYPAAQPDPLSESRVVSEPEPVAIVKRLMGGKIITTISDTFDLKEGQLLYAAPQPVDPLSESRVVSELEPFASLYVDPQTKDVSVCSNLKLPNGITPLYAAAPPQRKPLPEKLILEVAAKYSLPSSVVSFVREIETHGIKEPT